MDTKGYQLLKDGDQYTIGKWDEGYKAYIINDGIYGCYWWDTAEQAQAAADAYNSYDGDEWLWQHGYGNDTICICEADDVPPEQFELYHLFHAVNYTCECEKD